MITLATTIGPRAEQADACGVIALSACTVSVLCDGVGSGGAEAARTCVAAVHAEIRRRGRALVRPTWSRIDDVLHGAVDAARRAVEPLGYRRETTLLIAIVWSDRFALAHVGDSRAWLTTYGALRPLVQPHGFMHYVRSTIPRPDQIDIIHVDLLDIRDGSGAGADRTLVLASDGLSEPIGGTAAQMVEDQIRRGAQDNTTVIVIPLGRELDREIGDLVTLGEPDEAETAR